MRIITTNLLLVILLFVAQSASTPSFDFRSGRHNNVCKDLKNDVLLYFVFVDTRTTYPWTEFDILTTIDSIHAATRRNLPRKSVNETLDDQNLIEGMVSLSRWGDYVAKMIGESLDIKEKDGIPLQKRPTSKERLIALLRDEYNVESVALLSMVNNYFRSDISLAVNTLHNNDVEFSVVSYKYPSEIAHSFLHLFGAADLHETHFRRSNRKIRLANQAFPDDIMSNVYDAL